MIIIRYKYISAEFNVKSGMIYSSIAIAYVTRHTLISLTIHIASKYTSMCLISSLFSDSFFLINKRLIGRKNPICTFVVWVLDDIPECLVLFESIKEVVTVLTNATFVR
jgi:hypothetical protein